MGDMTATQALAFFSCAIKSGEPWSDTYQQAMDDALAEINKLTAERDELRRRIRQLETELRQSSARHKAVIDAEMYLRSAAVSACADTREAMEAMRKAFHSVILERDKTFSLVVSQCHELRRRIMDAPRGTPRVPNVMGSQRVGPVARIEVDDKMVGHTYALVRMQDDEL